MIQLIAIERDLYYPSTIAKKWHDEIGMEDDGKPLMMVHRYPEGDVDSIHWPNPNRKNLSACLFDDRECGLIGDEEVLLPDGTSAWNTVS